jgi:hypothetical protein
MAGYAGDGLESLFRMWIVESSRHWLRGDLIVECSYSKGSARVLTVLLG